MLSTQTTLSRQVIFGLLLVALQLAIPAYGQFLTPSPSETATTETGPKWPADTLGRRSPRGTVLGFIKAVEQENYYKASQYLNLSDIPKKKLQEAGPQLAQSLQKLLDQQGNLIPRTLISNDSTGLVSDDLGPNLDLVGTAEANGEKFDILVEKTKGPFGGPIWRFSSETVQRIPALSEKAESFTIERILPEFLITTKWNGVPAGHWLAMIILVALSYLLARIITAGIVTLLGLLWHKAREQPKKDIIQAFGLPIRIYVAVWLLILISQNIGISIIVRQKFSNITLVVGLVAFLLLVWRLIDVISRYMQRRLLENGQPGGLSAVLFFRRGIKILLIAFGIIAILNILGWDVTTGLAALGIGGIALALGAQKTIENFVGSITIIADQPLRVGDFCKIDDTTGTVEQIGMRSTRIRTADRTLIVIPNGQLASLKIENFAYRDRLLFNPKIQLRYETTPDQIRYLLVELRAILHNHPQVTPDPARVRFVGLGENSLDVDIFAYVGVRDFSEFLAIKEDLLLQIVDLVNNSGTGFAFPSQTLYMNQDNTMSEEKTRQAEQKLRAWQDKNGNA